MGGRAGGGARGGGGAAGMSAAMDRATTALYNAYNGGGAEALKAAKKQVAAEIAKMPLKQIEANLWTTTQAAYATRKGVGPKSEYNAKVHRYNTALSRLYNNAYMSKKGLPHYKFK